MELFIKHYSDLDKDTFHDLIALRIDVFVVEQNCPYQEVDGLDKGAHHLYLKENNQIIGTLRILKPGTSYKNEYAIGRVVSHTKFRDRKIGHHMMTHAMDFLLEDLKVNNIRLSGQSHLKKFYERYNFKSTGKEYLEDGIPHTDMLYTPDSL